jgi:hypothetical protein
MAGCLLKTVHDHVITSIPNTRNEEIKVQESVTINTKC